MKTKVEKGILIYSGLVAGAALMGIIVAGIATLGLDVTFGVNILPGLTQSPIFSTVIFAALELLIYTISCKEDK